MIDAPALERELEKYRRELTAYCSGFVQLGPKIGHEAFSRLESIDDLQKLRLRG
jgi:hypothetical protein